MKKVKTFTGTIYCGLKKGYNGEFQGIHEVRNICQAYCNGVGLCITLTQTEFIYSNGNEPGVIIGFINYPRFPKKKKQIKKEALILARMLKSKLQQHRVSLVFDDETIMIGKNE